MITSVLASIEHPLHAAVTLLNARLEARKDKIVKEAQEEKAKGTENTPPEV